MNQSIGEAQDAVLEVPFADNPIIHAFADHLMCIAQHEKMVKLLRMMIYRWKARGSG